MIDSVKISENAVVICNFLELTINDKRARKNPEYRIPFSNIPMIEYDPWGDEHQEGWLSVEKDVRASETLFHSDWNWLIIVINKFKEVWRKEGYESMSRETDKLAQNIYVDTLNIEYTYKACVEFINWHNKQ
jgi:hypothetical protein